MSIVAYISEKLTSSVLLHPATLLPWFILSLFIFKGLSFNVSTTQKRFPPSPPRLPIIGNLHQLNLLPHRPLWSLSQKYGELMMLCLGSKPVLVVSSANAAYEVMKTNDPIFSDRPPRAIFKRLLYGCKDVAAAPYGDHWRQMRSICVLQLLSNKRVQSFRNIREEEMGLLMEKIEGSSSSFGVNLGELFTTYTSNLTCRVAFGRKYEGEEGGTHFKKLINEFNELLGGFHVGEFIPWLGWIDRLSGLDAKTNKVAEEFDKFLERIVQEHLDRLNGGGAKKSGEVEKIKDLADVLLKLQNSDTSIDNDSIKALILDIFLAGTETSSTLLEWAITELIRHPTVMKLVQEEVRGVARGKDRITESDLEKMEYLKAVIKETLRLHPPLPLLFPRMSTQDVELNGYHVPAQTQVLFNAWAIHRDPTFWEEPEEFHPERFLKNPIDFRGQDFHLIPFGAGRRGCPGADFAISTTTPVLASLIHKFNWGLPGGVKGEALDIDEHPGTAVRRKSPLLLVATPCYT